MIAKTHVSFALCVALAPISLASFALDFEIDRELLGIFMASVFLGSLFPDIDEPSSKIGRKFTGVSNLIKAVFGHRGVTHFFIIPTIFTLVFLLFLPKNLNLAVAGAGFIIGYFLHILGDALTKSGIKNAFYPFFKGKVFALLPVKFRFYTNSAFERTLLLPTLVFIVSMEIYAIFGDKIPLDKLINEFQILSIF